MIRPIKQVLNAKRKAEPAPAGEVSEDELFRLHHARVVRLCMLLLGDPDEAEETAQDVFLKLMRQNREGPAPNDWSAWLTRVSVNACHDRRRSGWWKWWRRDGREMLDSDLPARDTEAEAIGREQQAAVWRGLRTLSQRQQEVFVLRQIEGWSTREVAAALELTDQSVKLHLFRATRRLREALRGQR